MNPKLILFCGPSGSGKTSIVQHLLKKFPQLSFSVSATTRTQRNGEVNGKDYYFISVDSFHEKIRNDEFLEWEEVYTDNYYGTLRAQIEDIWRNGNFVVFDVDVIGGLNLKRIFGKDALAIFVQPPSIDELEKRLRHRSTETEEKIQQRMSKARIELEKAGEFDVVIINDNLEEAIDTATAIVSKFLVQ